jgi:hypothetical protein
MLYLFSGEVRFNIILALAVEGWRVSAQTSANRSASRFPIALAGKSSYAFKEPFCILISVKSEREDLNLRPLLPQSSDSYG